MNPRYIYLSGFYCTAMATDFRARLEALEEESNEDIYVFIDSFGGCCAAMMSIIDAMDRCSCDIVTMCQGRCMSAGAMTLACGTKGKRLSLPNTQIMFHEPNGIAMLTDTGLAPMGHIRKYMTEMIAKRLDKTIAEVERDFDRDFYMMPEEALRLGYIDGIVGADRAQM